VTHVTDPALLEIADRADLAVPRGEPRRLVAEVARALLAREPEPELRARLEAAAEELLDDEARRTLAEAGADGDFTPDSPLAAAVAYRAALPVLAREPGVTEPHAEVEPVVAELDEEDLAAYSPALARAAVPALAVDVELLKDEGYRYVATYPRKAPRASTSSAGRRAG
jgi:hypothetical protein